MKPNPISSVLVEMEELQISFRSLHEAIQYFSMILPDPKTTEQDSIIEIFNVIGYPRKFSALKCSDDWSIAMII